MTAYVIAAETVKDDAMFDEYRKQVPATLAPFGGKFIVRGGKVTVQEGEWPHPRTVVIEFPSLAQALAAHETPGYQDALRKLGKGDVDRDMRVVEGPE